MSIVYIQKKSDGMPFDGIAFAAFEGFNHLGYDVRLFTNADLIMGAVNPTRETPVVGTVDMVRAVWRRLGVTVPSPLDYPKSLRSLLDRDITLTVMGEVRDYMSNPSLRERQAPFFLKPAARHKLFTGFVCLLPDHLNKITFVDDSEPVWVSDLAQFDVEQRVFVFNGEIIHAATYNGDPFRTCSKDFVESAVRTYQESGRSPVAYAADFGLKRIDSPITRREPNLAWMNCLVEVNDAWALGPYTLATDDYARMLAARWAEVCGCEYSA